MIMIGSIAMREIRSMFLSPLAWVILAVVQFVLAYMFLGQVDIFLQLQPRLGAMVVAPGVTEIVVAPLFGNAAIVLLLVVPIMTMRLISEERRNQTLALLFSAPVSMTEIVFGKYLGLLAFLLFIMFMVVLMSLSLLVAGSIDFGVMFSALIGLVLLTASFVAVGLYISTLTAHPAVAAVGTFGALLLLWIIDWAGSGRDGETANIFGYLSLMRHYEPLLQGVFDSRDIIYFLLFAGVFLILSIRHLDSYRLQH